MAYKIRLSFVFGIALVTIVAWFRNIPALTYFPDTEVGDAKFSYFSQVVDITGLDLIFVPYTKDLSGAGLAISTMLYVDFLDTSGTLLGIANSMGIVDKTGNFEGSKKAFSVDALATMIGSIFGLSPITSYIESGAGVEAGSKTGLTSVIVGVFFFISIFFAPILASIPPWAIGGALILVGSLMARSLTKLNFNRVSHAVSGFLTVMVMPFTYSIAYGLIAGIGSFVVMESVFLILNKLFCIPIPTDKEEITLAAGKSIFGNTTGNNHDDDDNGKRAEGENENVNEAIEQAVTSISAATEKEKKSEEKFVSVDDDDL